jgi:hypothetical protein
VQSLGKLLSLSKGVAANRGMPVAQHVIYYDDDDDDDDGISGSLYLINKLSI